MGLAVRTVFAFAVGRFGIDIDIGLRTDGNPDADLYAGIAVFAVLMLAVLGGEQPDVARGIEADGVARSNVAALDGNVALAAADIDVAASFQAALPALAVVLVLFLTGGFKAKAGFNGQEDGTLLAGLVFKGIGHFADAIGQLVGLGTGGQGLHRKKIQGSKPPTLTRYSVREKISYPTAYRFLQRCFQDDR